MLFLANDDNIVLPSLYIVLYQFLASTSSDSRPQGRLWPYVHEGNTDHTQSNNHNFLPFAIAIDFALLL
jgi:hypothetical protein